MKRNLFFIGIMALTLSACGGGSIADEDLTEEDLMIIQLDAEIRNQKVSASITEVAEPDLEVSGTYSVRKQLRCLPDAAAFVVAHRGVSKGAGHAENSRLGLRGLIEKGIMFAEVDVAGLSDGTHILFNDGKWDDKTTGWGVVAATDWNESQRMILMNTEGNLTASRPINLRDTLLLAKDKLYLKIDFTASADIETVVAAVDAAKMADQVIYNAYNEKQAGRIAYLAPGSMISLPLAQMSDIKAYEAYGVRRSNMVAWLGRGPYSEGLLSDLKSVNIPVLAWPPKASFAEKAAPAVGLVTKYSYLEDPILNMSGPLNRTYKECLDAPDKDFVESELPADSQDGFDFGGDAVDTEYEPSADELSDFDDIEGIENYEDMASHDDLQAGHGLPNYR